MTNNKKIQILNLIKESYKVISKNRGRYSKLLLIPFSLLLVLGLGVYFVESSQTRSFLAVSYSWLTPVIMIPVVTSWHRLILLGESEKSVRIRYAYNSEEWLYFKALFVLVIAFIVTNFLLSILFGPIFVGFGQLISEKFSIAIYRLVLLAIIFLILCRFLLILPAAALGKRMDIANSSLIMSGNALRITAAYILALIVPQIILLVTGSPTELLIFGYEFGSILGILLLVISIIIMMAFYTLSVGVLSFAYKSLVLDESTA